MGPETGLNPALTHGTGRPREGCWCDMGDNKTIMSSARLQVGVGRVAGVAAGRGYQRVFKAWGGVT